jgi:hypothetical protein
MVPEFLAQLIATEQAEYRRETIGFAQYLSMLVPEGKLIYITQIEINPFVNYDPTFNFTTPQQTDIILKEALSKSLFQIRIFNQKLNYRITYRPDFNLVNNYYYSELTFEERSAIFPTVILNKQQYTTLIKADKDIFISSSVLEQQAQANQLQQLLIANNRDNDQPFPYGSKNSPNLNTETLQSGASATYLPFNSKYTSSAPFIPSNSEFFVLDPSESNPFPKFNNSNVVIVNDYPFIALNYFLNVEFVVVNLKPGA